MPSHNHNQNNQNLQISFWLSYNKLPKDMAEKCLENNVFYIILKLICVYVCLCFCVFNVSEMKVM